MLGWQIFKHSFSMVTRNLGKAIHICAVPWVIAVAIILVLALAMGVSFDSLTSGAAGGGLVGGLLLVLIILVGIATALWIAVAWHRYILLGESPSGLLPPIHQDRMLAYLGRGFVLFLLFMVTGAILLGLVASMAAVIPAVALIIGFAVGLAMVVIFYRLSVILPAAALGQSMSLTQALEHTRGATVTIVIIALSLFMTELAIQTVTLLLSFIPVVGVLASIAATMFTTMLGISILTTLYGYYIEKRELS